MASDSSTAKDKSKDDDNTKRIYLVSYPKVVFLYPSYILGIICWISAAVETPTGQAVNPEKAATALQKQVEDEKAAESDDEKTATPADIDLAKVETGATTTLSLIFLMVFGFNLVVLAFDFPRTASLTWFAVLAVVALGLALLFTQKPELIPVFTGLFKKLTPFANASFYGIFTVIMTLIYVAVIVSVQFDYWEVRPNELLHHHGVLSDLERFAAPNLRIDKEINDLFEYFLLRSGRLILHPSQERRAVVLENVFFINRKEKEITKMLGALQVQVREEGSST